MVITLPRFPGRHAWRAVLFCFLLSGGAAVVAAQQIAGRSSSRADLPDAPSFQAAAATAGIGGSASIGGTVLDINDGVVPNAAVTLIFEGAAGTQPPERVITSDSEGRFLFPNLPAGKFKVTIVAAGLSTFVSNEIVLRAAEHHELPHFGLPIASANVDVQVTVTQVEIAQEQIKEEEHQRAFGVFPNFYSSYIWDAAPLSNKQKFDLAFHSISDPVIFVATGVAAGIEQARNTFPAYHQGAKGYARRYGAGYADEVTNRMFSSAIYPALFNQDPRYFYRGSGTKAERAWYAITRAFVTRGDNGRSQPNYSRILGAFTSGGISNIYHQGNDRGLGLTFRNSSIAIGGSAADNLLREFLFRRITPKVPDYKNGKPAATP